MKKYLAIIPAVILVVSCHTDSRKDKLCRKWQEVSVDNPQYDAVAAKELATLAKLTDKDTSLLRNVYGVSTADSARDIGKFKIAQRSAMQDAVTAQTWFLFEKDGKVQIHSKRGIVEAMWKLEGDRLMMSKEGSDIKREWKVTQISDTSLHITVVVEGGAANVRFVPAAQ